MKEVWYRFFMWLNEFLDPKNGEFNIFFIILPSEIKILKKIMKRDQCSLTKRHRVAKKIQIWITRKRLEIFSNFFFLTQGFSKVCNIYWNYQNPRVVATGPGWLYMEWLVY